MKQKPCPQFPSIQWRRVNDEPYEYAIQQGARGDEFVKLADGTCLRRAIGRTMPSRDELVRIIVSNMECEKDCQSYPKGCGCADDAAAAILARLSPAKSMENLEKMAQREFFMVVQPPPGDIRNDEQQIAKSLGVVIDENWDVPGCYEHREDAEIVCSELNRRSHLPFFRVIGSKDFP